MGYRKILLLFIVILLFLSMTGCMPGDRRYTQEKPAGFFWGIWHGWIAPVSLIVGFFNRSVRIYEVNNTGWFYDLGFYISIIGGFGSLAFFRNKKQS